MLRFLPLIFLISAGNVLAKDLFKIAPYFVVEDKGSLTLNFQPQENTELEVTVDNHKFFPFKNKRSGLWTADKLHKIDLGKLKCGVELKYTIKAQDQVIDHALHALPCDADEPLYVGFMSDTQIKNNDGQLRAERLTKAISTLQETTPFSLIINAGDIVQHGGFEAEWVNFFNTTSSYLKTSYLFAAVGNHEYYESPSQDKLPKEFMNYMRNGVGSELGYAQLDLGRVNFLMINSNFESISEEKITEQWEWLEGKLKTSKFIRKPTIVVMHHSPFSANLEHLREIPSRLRRELVPMLEKYKVKMMLSGHLHMYERSQKAGITYLIAGPSGGINNVISYKNPYSVFVRQFATTFSVLKFNTDKIEVTTYEGNRGSVVETFNVEL